MRYTWTKFSKFWPKFARDGALDHELRVEGAPQPPRDCNALNKIGKWTHLGAGVRSARGWRAGTLHLFGGNAKKTGSQFLLTMASRVNSTARPAFAPSQNH
jgi:hypothetical protein